MKEGWDDIACEGWGLIEGWDLIEGDGWDGIEGDGIA